MSHVPFLQTITKKITASYKLTLTNKNLYSARYYLSADGKSIYEKEIYYDIKLTPSYIKYEFVMANIPIMTGYAYKLSQEDGFYWDSKYSNTIFLSNDNVLIAGQGQNQGLGSTRIYVLP